MNIDADNLPYLWQEAHARWAEAHEAAEIADQKVKVLEAEVFSQSEGSAEARKMTARMNPTVKKAVYEAIQLRTRANLALGERGKLEKLFDLWRTKESTERARMTLR